MPRSRAKTAQYGRTRGAEDKRCSRSLCITACAEIAFSGGETALDAFLDFWNALDLTALLGAALRLAAVLLCLTVHETCHGLAAYALGDPTAKQRHRLSLNPLHHIDWFGLAAMLLLGFGWAKPVPVDMRYFKNPKRGMALTALAGPASNLLLAPLLLLGARGILALSPDSAAWGWTYAFLMLSARLSVGLGVFNLIPISPLDGSKVLFALLPDAQYDTLMRYERYGLFLLYALLLFGALDGFLSTAVNAVYDTLLSLIFH
ncbi:MAG: site-2 protease family protein [Oscillospiraceae bacterium]|nr:site-2 protease family protein [Oscillospiraceae bacterium]